MSLFKDIVKLYFPRVVFDYVQSRKGDIFSSEANPKPLAELGWKSEVNIREGINECFEKLLIEIQKQKRSLLV